MKTPEARPEPTSREASAAPPSPGPPGSVTEQIDRPRRLCQSERGLRVGRLEHAVAFAAQDPEHEGSHRLLVLNHQHGLGAARHSGGAAATDAVGLDTNRAGKIDCERAAFPGLGGDLDRAPALAQIP